MSDIENATFATSSDFRHHVRELTDINAREFAMMALLAIAVLAMGLYPKPFTDVMHTSVDALIKHVAQPKLP